MEIKFKFDLGAAVKTPEGDGHIVMAAVNKEDGQTYLVQLSAGRCWTPEDKVEAFVPKQPKKDGEGKGAGKSALIALLLTLGALLLGARAQAQPAMADYVSRQDLSTSTNWAEVAFPGAAEKQIVLKSFDVQSDSATNETWIIAGTMPVAIHYSLNNTQLVVLTNSNIGTNQLAIIQMTGATNTFVVNILYTNQLTNVFIGGPGPVLPALATAWPGSLTNTNGILWVCTNRFRIWPGVGKLSQQGEAVFSAQVRAPLAIRTGSITGPAGGASNQVRNATMLYKHTP